MSKKERDKTSKELIYITSVFLFVIGFVLGILFKSLYPTENPPYTQTRENGYEYINPLIDFETTQSTKNKDLLEMEDTLNEYIQEVDTQSHISVYYKDLNSGGWMGIHEDERFSPASLLKVPIMIAMYKIGETDSTFLNQKVVFNSQNTLQQNILPENHLISGEEYTLDELISQMIKYSDNTVLETLAEYLPRENEEEVFTDLGLTSPYQQEEDLIDIMSVKEYASFFRILYNASYLNKDMSTKALKLLSSSTYTKGIRESIPQDIKVAHKFGEREILEGQYKIQLHDCGIVYYPQKPYLICIMTKGHSLETLSKNITQISKIVYDVVDR